MSGRFLTNSNYTLIELVKFISHIFFTYINNKFKSKFYLDDLVQRQNHIYR